MLSSEIVKMTRSISPVELEGAFVETGHLSAGVSSHDVEGLRQRIRCDMHLRHLDLIDLLAVDVQLPGASEWLRLDEIEFEVGLALGKLRRLQYVVDAVEEIVVVVEATDP